LEAFSAHVKGSAHVRFAFDLSLTVTPNGWGIEVPTNDFRSHTTVLEGTPGVSDG
jgi:hypothetical protein